MLKVDNLHKSFGSKEVLKGISFEVKDGEIYGFIGHNGAGKTTTIKAIVGILDFDQGQISIDGHDIVKEPITCKQQLAYIPDNPDLYENLTGIAYLTFIANIFDLDNEVSKQRIEKLAKELEIYDNLGDQIKSYSHGMKQKVALIGAFIHEPKLLVLDEPFVGLDPKASFILKQHMSELCSKGSSIFFSTHVLEVVEKLCHRVTILRQGEIVKTGVTEEILKPGQSLEDLFLELE